MCISFNSLCSQTKDGDEMALEAKVNVPGARSVNLFVYRWKITLPLRHSIQNIRHCNHLVT